VPGYYGNLLGQAPERDHRDRQRVRRLLDEDAYRIPDTPCGCVEPGTAPKARSRSIASRPFLSSPNVADGAKLKPGSTKLKGIAFDGGKGIKEVAVTIDGGKTWTPARLGKDLGKYSFREWTAAGEARGRQLRAQGSRHQQCRRTRSR